MNRSEFAFVPHIHRERENKKIQTVWCEHCMIYSYKSRTLKLQHDVNIHIDGDIKLVKCNNILTAKHTRYLCVICHTFFRFTYFIKGNDSFMSLYVQLLLN